LHELVGTTSRVAGTGAALVPAGELVDVGEGSGVNVAVELGCAQEVSVKFFENVATAYVCSTPAPSVGVDSVRAVPQALLRRTPARSSTSTNMGS
jgi:hypothetical protein